MPAKFKSEPWARLGVNVDADFEPLYIISPDKKSTVTELKGLLKDVDELYLATDGDREGEAIAWHLLETLKPRIPVKRMVFHEITEPAIRAAASTRATWTTTWSMRRRRAASWTGCMATRSARCCGRRSRPNCRPAVCSRWPPGSSSSVSATGWRSAAPATGMSSPNSTPASEAKPQTFTARLVGVADRRVATGRDFDSLGLLKNADGVLVLDEESASALARGLRGAELTVSSVDQKPYTRKPYPPFMTSTLQQEAGRKLRFSSERTMSVAQRLFENGYITYMRTDSTTLSQSAIDAARRQAGELYGDEYVHPTPRQYTRKVKNAQEAHEAIRPAGESFSTPGQLHSALDNDEFRLYELIWQRTVASQMADARGSTLSLRITGRSVGGISAG